jgi:plastocyanin
MYADGMTQSYYFDPTVVTINVGDMVNWTAVLGSAETVSLPNQSEWWSSGLVPEGGSFAFTFTIPGTYNYTCTVDPYPMNGQVVVLNSTPTPEFPGFMIAVAVALAVSFGLVIERKLRT